MQSRITVLTVLYIIMFMSWVHVYHIISLSINFNIVK